LYLNPSQKDAQLGEVFPIEILLDAQNKDINAVEMKVGADSEYLRLKDFSDGGSIMNYWAEKPKVDEEGALSFQGAILGGFKGGDGKLLTLYYETLKPGKTAINIQVFTTVYLNDGKGTKANLEFNGTAVNISSEQFKGLMPSIVDTTPPETLEAKISRASDIFDGQYFLVFSAKDEGSGLDYIEIKEGDEEWVRTDSPYLLKNQKLNQNILIKAVDKNGNARIETLNLKQYQLIKKIVYGVVIVIIILAIWQIFRKKKPKIA
jgi:hypothetical protein